MNIFSFFWPLVIAILVWFAYNIVVIERKKRQSHHFYDVHITLDDLEKIFFNGKERTYDTPHGVLHVYPDPKHVLNKVS